MFVIAMRIKLCGLILLLSAYSAGAQQVFYPVESAEAYQAYRLQMLGNWRSSHDARLNRFSRLLYKSNDSGDIVLIASNSDKPLLKYFYKQNNAFFKTEEAGKYSLIINPVFQFVSGRDDTGMIYRNTRGIELLGNIGGMEKGIGFYSLLTENQELLPHPYRYFTDSLNFVPNEFFYKKFKKEGAVDFFQARAYVTFNAAKDHVKFQFGHDKHKIGNGYRSLILSDYSPQYLFLKINTDVGRFHYQNLFTQFTDNGPVLSNILYGKKYAALHRLSVDVLRNLNIGINEMVIFDRIDSTQSNQFDFNYLNPVIFYRSIESNLGSRDNSLMAADLNWIIRNRYVVYAQFLLDEFNLKFLKNEPGWWANKYGYQVGVRAFDFMKIDNLDLMAEYNRMRPFAYSHKRPTQSYSHFNQPLAHPLGANFSEMIIEIKYRAFRKWHFNSTLVYAVAGRDSFLSGSNYGSNLLRSYDSRATEFGSKMFIGRKTDFLICDVGISYMFRYNLFVDARLNYRKAGNSDNLFFSLGLRLNSTQRKFDY